MWLWANGERISTLDLYDARFTLLTSRHGTRWQSAAEQANTKLAVPLACHTIGPDGPLIDSNDEWAHLYGVEHDGAVLVRPDGHVACRVPTLGDDAPSETLTTALRRILSFAPPVKSQKCAIVRPKFRRLNPKVCGPNPTFCPPPKGELSAWPYGRGRTFLGGELWAIGPVR